MKTSWVRPGTGHAPVQHMTLRTEELKNRVVAKQKQLEPRLSELKADAQAATADEIERIKTRLSEVREAVKGGWDNLSEQSAKKLNEWLTRAKA